MRVLYNNLLDHGTVTATSENLNYPVSNLTYQTQRSRTLLALFKATSNTTTITIELDGAYQVDSLGIGNHNLAGLTMQLYDSSGMVGTETYTADDLKTTYSTTRLVDTSIQPEPDATYYFKASDGNFYNSSGGQIIIQFTYKYINRIVLTCTTDENVVSIGGLYIGEQLRLQAANAFQPIDTSLTSSVDVTIKGVVSGRRGVSLASVSWPMDGVTKEVLDDYITMFEYVQNNRPMFIDPNEGTGFRQWFGRITNETLSAEVYHGGDYSTSISFEEVR